MSREYEKGLEEGARRALELSARGWAPRWEPEGLVWAEPGTGTDYAFQDAWGIVEEEENQAAADLDQYKALSEARP